MPGVYRCRGWTGWEDFEVDGVGGVDWDHAFAVVV